MPDVRTICLGVLMYGERSGYDIRQDIHAGGFSELCEAGFGSIYPALNRLNQEGMVTCRAVEQAKRPDKKVYAITEQGRRHFLEVLSRDQGPDKFRSDKLFQLVFANELPLSIVEKTLDGIIEEYRRKNDFVTTECDEEIAASDLTEAQLAATDFVRGMAQAVFKAKIDYVQQNRDGFLERLLMLQHQETTNRDPGPDKPE